MIEAITKRRSIRRYQDKDVPRYMVEEIIQAGILAPSAKNRQPWKFVVVTGAAKAAALAAMEQGLGREKKEPLLPESAGYLGGAEHTLAIMRQASVVILIVNILAKKMENKPYVSEKKNPAQCDAGLSIEERVAEICNIQSVGAAIENMTLQAAELGLGSLWICDTFFAQKELDEWLGTEGELAAALAVGYADEAPAARPRKSFEEVVEWKV